MRMNMIKCDDILSSDHFDQLMNDEIYDIESFEANERFNHCKPCDVAMVLVAEGYQCPNCYSISEMVGGFKDSSNTNNHGSILSSTSGSKLLVISTYTLKSQKKTILLQLTCLNAEYTSAPKIPQIILERTAQKYNDTQNIIIEKYDHTGAIVSEKKFVRRGNIKNETLGAWLYYCCIKGGTSRKKTDIAAFMKLTTNGISRGCNILRTLHNEGKVTIPLFSEPSQTFTRRYLIALGLYTCDHQSNVPTDESIRYEGFVNDLVAAAIKKHFMLNSMKSSKIVGSIWILIQHLKLPITSSHLEKMCDKTRKNTFSRFSKAISDNLLRFLDIFLRWDIPHGIRGRIIKIAKT